MLSWTGGKSCTHAGVYQRIDQSLSDKHGSYVPPTVSFPVEGLSSGSCPCSRSYSASQSPPYAASQRCTALLSASDFLLLISRTMRRCKASATFPWFNNSLNCAVPDAFTSQVKRKTIVVDGETTINDGWKLPVVRRHLLHQDRVSQAARLGCPSSLAGGQDSLEPLGGLVGQKTRLISFQVRASCKQSASEIERVHNYG